MFDMKATKILVFFLLCCLSSKSVLSSPGRYSAIFNFGNSPSDTGNFLLTRALAFPGIKHFYILWEQNVMTTLRSLFLVGEMGGNDYIFPFIFGRTIKQIHTLVPQVVAAIARAIRMLKEEGAVDLVVPGLFPIGCTSLFLTLFQSANESPYDPRTGCFKAYNAFAKYHDNFLIKELQILREQYPHGRIMCVYYYITAMSIYRAPKHYGFYGGTLRACCGGGGPYNFNTSAICGHTGSTACKDPSAFVDWDRIYLTESAYHHIAKGLINVGFTSPPLLL